MRLVIFDIDDTLARAAHVFDPFFFGALEAHLGVDGIDRSLTGWRHVTDQGIAEEAVARAGRDPASIDLHAVRTDYLAAMRACDAAVEMVPGADAALTAVAAHPEWRAAIATGNWDEAGRIKLARAHLPVEGLPYAGCDERPHRMDVMRRALELAVGELGQAFERVVYVGDAPWDVEAARSLDWPFVGIVDQSGRVRGQGASHVLRDFGDREAFFHALDEARTPAPS